MIYTEILLRSTLVISDIFNTFDEIYWSLQKK